MRAFRYSSWSIIFENCAISSLLWLSLSSKRHFSPSKTASFVVVEPGFSTRMRSLPRSVLPCVMPSLPRSQP